MEISAEQLNEWLSFYFWPFMRVTGVMVIAPVFAARTIPVRARLLATVLITFTIAPTLPPVPLLDPFTIAGVIQIINQFVIGFAMGFVVFMIFAAFTVGAQTMGMSMGLGFATAIDPNNGVQVPVLAQFYVLFATLIFLAINGHLMILDTLKESFVTMPISHNWLSQDSVWSLVSWGKMMFIGGVKMALPVIVTLLLINISLGVVTRAAPQLNIFAVGFPISIAVGFWLVSISFPKLFPRLTELMESAFSTIFAFRLVGG
ncbi:MAG: flagellar biosynthetic protein FliR [Thiotrichales bacterium]|jgi:flagellar biosynthetic protein FliR|nr:flagellar biosynthetic protein FliR [Thiotrichales bacterium]MBT3612975.1 flagellar biosynthetic protein FliR [Thiotrichales bacterium]MBT4262355.1 flagellar biosynthetic protein FliR [Thiotrichales bacterium]MBT4971436.1 flagellar biosynthetic protein FliR [Thiotrichales bacterium]MBT5291301.1 flagellar biosynthetic protein FliR [Thiotrichales bacterium]